MNAVNGPVQKDGKRELNRDPMHTSLSVKLPLHGRAPTGSGSSRLKPDTRVSYANGCCSQERSIDDPPRN